MKLKTVRTRHFKHVLDSSPVDIQTDITCLVGKNESGKSAFLEALRRLKPAQGSVKFSSATHYPAWLEKRHRRDARAKGLDLDETQPITATFTLEKADKDAVAAVFGEGVLSSDEFEISRKYNNNYNGSFKVNEARAVANLLSGFELSKPLEQLKRCKTFSALDTEIANLAAEGGEVDDTKLMLASVVAAIKEVIPNDLSLFQAVWRILFAQVPKFFYFSEYSGLPSTVPIRKLLAAKEDDLTEGEHTALALLQLAEFEQDHLLDIDYETRKRELENASNELRSQVLEYWSTNRNLRVEMDLTQKQQAANNGTTTVIDELHIRLRDDQHELSLRF
jgi:hypothetical protein